MIGPSCSAASPLDTARILATVAMYGVPVLIGVDLDLGLISAHAVPRAADGIRLILGRASRSFARTISRSPSARDR